MATISSLKGFFGEDFQKFCSVLLCRHFDGFHAVEGTGGDKGNDGFFACWDTLFQAYAPPKGSPSKLRRKIDTSLKKATELRKSDMPKLKRLIFLTPNDLTHAGNLYLFQRAERAGLTAEAWGESKLLALLSQHPEVKAEFPNFLLPDVLEEIRTMRRDLAQDGDDVSKIKRELAEAVFTTLADLADAFRPWIAGTIKFEDLAPKLNILIPTCGKLHRRAALYLEPEIGRAIEAIVEHVNQIYAADQNLRMYKSVSQGTEFAGHVTTQFDLARRRLPEKIQEVWKTIEPKLKQIVKDSGGTAADDDRYQKFIARVRPLVLANPRSIVLKVNDSDVDLAYRARKEGDLDVEVVGGTVVLLPPGTVQRSA